MRNSAWAFVVVAALGVVALFGYWAFQSAPGDGDTPAATSSAPATGGGDSTSVTVDTDKGSVEVEKKE